MLRISSGKSTEVCPKFVPIPTTAYSTAPDSPSMEHSVRMPQSFAIEINIICPFDGGTQTQSSSTVSATTTAVIRVMQVISLTCSLGRKNQKDILRSLLGIRISRPSLLFPQSDGLPPSVPFYALDAPRVCISYLWNLPRREISPGGQLFW